MKLVLTLFAISIIVFGLTAMAGNPAHDILGQDATPEQIEAFTLQHNLDDPVVVRYVTWLGGILHGDFGVSYTADGSVWALIEPRLGRSLLLVAIAWVLTVVVAIPLGLWAGVRLRGKADGAATIATLSLAAFPEFAVGLVLITIFAVNLKWLPVDSTAVSASGIWDAPEAFVLPAVTIALGTGPYIVRLMRANARDVASHTHVRSAVLRGIGEPALSVRHILPNAAPPVISALGLQLAALIGGTIVVETLFGFPGLGQLMVLSAAARDAPTVVMLTLMIGTAFVVINLMADALVLVLTPKLRDAAR